MLGFGVISELSERGVQVFDDAKIIEIPSKIEKLAQIHVQHQPWMLNMMGNGLSSGKMEAPKPDEVEAMKRFADVCLTAGVEPCLVTVLTSKTDQMVELEYGEGRNRIEVVLMYLDVAREAGFTNFVCSIAELPSIRAETRFDQMQGNHPGARLPGSDAHDQASVGTPRGIVEAGGTRLVIGRDLTGDDAAEKWVRINANLRGEAA
jgi:orotidine-5'-phosphate decarboxylase